MSVIVISSDSPTFTCQSPACYIDAESIDTNYVYDSEYQSSCDSGDLITVSSTTSSSAGADGEDGADGRGIVSVEWASNSGGGSQGDPGTVDTYTITYTDATTDTFTVSNGEDGTVGPDGTAATITVGTTTTGDAGTNASVTNSGTSLDAVFDFTIPKGTDGTDGATIHLGTDVPDAGLGENGDLYLRTSNYMLYSKSADSWSEVGSIQGAAGEDGDPGVDGQDGDKWYYGSGEPTNSNSYSYTSYYLDEDTNDVYVKTSGSTTWLPITNFNGDRYKTTSATTLDLSSIIAGDSVTITLASDEMSYTAGQYLVVSTDSDNRLVGTVTSLSGTTLILEVTSVTGSASASSWDVNLAGVVESEITSRWYTITATAGTGAATTRDYSGPSGWTIDTSDVIAHSDLGSNNTDLTIEHNTGYNLAECIIFTTSGVINTKLEGTKAYSTVRENTSHTAIEILSLATVAQPLIIYVKLN